MGDCNMKRKYTRPALCVIRIEQTHIICGSEKDWDAMKPGESNQPAGARDYSEWEYEE